MKLTLIIGPAKCGKTRFIVKKFAKDIRNNPVIITPSSESVRFIKKLILSETNLEGFCGRRVITFDQIVNTAISDRSGLSNTGKYFLLRKLLSNMDMKYFFLVKDYIGFYEILSMFISELKSGEITPEILLEGINKKGLTEKDKEIYDIYSAYQEKLHRLNLYDHEGKFWEAQRLIDGGKLGPFLNCKLLIVDGFYNFSPVELKIIKSLSKYIDEIIITLDITQSKTYYTLKSAFINLREEKMPDKKMPPGKINIISCPGQLREIEEISREIKRLIIHSGRKPDDIAVLFRDLTDYKELIIEVFKKYGIPCSISEGIPLIKDPLVKTVLKQLENLPQTGAYAECIKIMQKNESEGLNKFVEALENSLPILENNITFADLVYIAESSELPPEPYRGGTVQIMDVHKARGLSFPVVFIGGLIEKGFPKQIAEEPFYGDIERQGLRKFGVNVEESKEKQKEEMFLFYTAVNTAREYLYLTYPATDTEGKEELPSYYIDEIKKLYPNIIEEKKVHISAVIPEFKDVYTYEDLVSRVMHDKDIKLCKYLNISALAKIAEIEENRVPPWNGIITDKKALGEIKINFGADYKFSVSQFNEYGTCPFSYFAKRVLSLLPIEELEDEIKPNEEGTLYHAILREVYAEKADLEDISEKHFKLTEEKGILKNKPLWEIKKKEILKNISNLLQYEKGEPPLGIKRTPAYFEKPFGMEGNKPLVIGGVKIQGIIDRIDLTEADFFVVVDYKSGSAKFGLNDILKGVNIQLPVYIIAAKDVLKAGIDALEGYFLYIKNRKYYHASPLVQFKKQKGKPIRNPLWDEYMTAAKKYVIEYAKGIRDGIFLVSPKDECPTYCDYKDICRYR